ncbi:MAG: prepilin peptidase [Pseudomonadota bacterium]
MSDLGDIPPLWLALFGIAVGAVIGSFINVLISRGPVLWGLVENENGGPKRGLAFPPSACEACGKRLKPFELIPILSFLALRGKCRYCGAPIGIRHLIIEIAGALIGAGCLIAFGPSLEALVNAFFLFILIALATIDAETGYLPDALVLPLLAAGWLVAAAGLGPPFLNALIGTVLGGGGLWLIAKGYWLWRRRDGLGGGDIKLVAAAGAWLGPFALPYVMLAASLSALVFVSLQMLLGKREADLSTALRFGPFLAGALALVKLLPFPAGLV